MIRKIKFDSREEWLGIRRSYIGGSDAAAVLGLSKWSSPLSVYADKLGLVPEREDNEAMRQGRDLEAYVAERWAEHTGLKVRRENHVLVNDDLPWMSANIDRRVVGLSEGLECKTTSVYNKTDFEGGDVPPEYYVQCQHYMAVTGWDVWHLAILVLNRGFYVFRVERNEADIAALIQAEKAFWYGHVVPGVAPEPTDADSELLGQLYGHDIDVPWVPLNGMEGTMDSLMVTKAKIKALEVEQKALENQIKAVLGEGGDGGSERFTVSWRERISKRLDSTRLRKELPDLWEEYSTESSARFFLIKENKQ